MNNTTTNQVWDEDMQAYVCTHPDTTTETVESWDGESTSEIETCLVCLEALETI